MKKQIALFATIIAASGLTALGQGYITFGSGTHYVWDEFSGTPGVGVSTANIDVALLWAASGTADNLSSVGTSGNFGLSGGAAANQVATNGVTSVSAANPISTITSMLSSGWQFVTNDSTGSAGFLTLASVDSTTKGQINYTGGSGGTGLLQVDNTSAGQTIELIAIGWNATTGTYLTASDLGWSNPITYLTGASSTDPNGGNALSSEGLNQFGVAAVPEPTTLALAGLGGLSMLFLRRRKA